jgi:hypothetical protein
MADHPPLTEERRQAYRHRAQLIAQRADRQLEQTLFRTSLAILALAATVAATTQIAHAEEESGTDTRMLMQERHEWAATPYRSLTTYGDIRRDKFPTGKITIREALAAEVQRSVGPGHEHSLHGSAHAAVHGGGRQDRRRDGGLPRRGVVELQV